MNAVVMQYSSDWMGRIIAGHEYAPLVRCGHCLRRVYSVLTSLFRAPWNWSAPALGDGQGSACLVVAAVWRQPFLKRRHRARAYYGCGFGTIPAINGGASQAAGFQTTTAQPAAHPHRERKTRTIAGSRLLVVTFNHAVAPLDQVEKEVKRHGHQHRAGIGLWKWVSDCQPGICAQGGLPVGATQLGS